MLNFKKNLARNFSKKWVRTVDQIFLDIKCKTNDIFVNIVYILTKIDQNLSKKYDKCEQISAS